MMALVLWQTLSLSVQGAQHQQLDFEKSTLDAATEISRNALISEEYDDLLPYIATVLQKSGITHVLVADGDNRVIASTKIAELGKPLPALTDTDHDYWRQREIGNTNERLGMLAIKFSNAKLVEATRQARNLGITIALTGITFIAIVGMLMGYLLTRRLSILTEAAKRFSRGELATKAQLTGNDEVAELGAAFDQMADNLQQQMSVLELRVSERTAELAIARDEAIKANQTKSMFLANMSHELRTPLNAVIGYSEILAEDLKDSPGKALADLNRIRSSGVSLLRMINDVLDLNKIESGKMEIVPEEFELSIVVKEAAEAVRPLMEKNQNKFIYSTENGKGPVFSDSIKIRQALINLLGNAAKFTTNGYVSLNVTREKDQAREFIIFQVQDTGIGIAKEHIDSLFTEFTQADMSISRSYGGTGLGLAICKKYCQMLGGDVFVNSVVGKGSVFTMRILARIDKANIGASPHRVMEQQR